MNDKQTNDGRFFTAVKQSPNKKTYVPDKLLEIMNGKKFFTNEDIELDNSCYEKWNSYEIKLIRRFLDENTHRYTVGELLDAGVISDSPHTRRKLIYSRFSKTKLLNQKKAEERENRINGIFEN